jgi:hypothetical protein
MKLTWFAGTTIRIHIGGQILVADADRAPASIEPRELVSGVDRGFALAVDDYSLAEIDPALWRPRRVGRPMDEPDGTPEIRVLRMGTDAVLVDAPGEPPLVLLAGAGPPRFGRWASDAVVVLFGTGEAAVALGTVLLDVAQPRLIALAADEPTVELAIAELGEHLDGTALVSLEPGLALEV